MNSFSSRRRRSTNASGLKYSASRDDLSMPGKLPRNSLTGPSSTGLPSTLTGVPADTRDEIPTKIAELRDAGRQREYLEEMGDLLIRRTFFLRGTIDVSEIDAYLQKAENAGHMVAVRSALLAKILHRGTEPGELAAHLGRLKSLDQSYGPTGAIGFRYAFGEACDSILSGPRSRLSRLRNEIRKVDFRTRSWIPVECFLDVAGLPLASTVTQWLEPYDVVLQRWHGHLNRYLGGHGEAPIGQSEPDQPSGRERGSSSSPL